MVNRSGFDVVSTNSNSAHMYEYACSRSNGSKNQLNSYLSTTLMSYKSFLYITLNNTIHRLITSLLRSFFQHDYVKNMQ